MNNLKRVLSLALASVMLIGMMAVGASAMTVADFSDADSIDAAKSEAVQGNVALKIIEGNDDGTFNPKGIVTRQQAAKMIYVALNAGKDSSSLTKRNPAIFTDVTDWSQGYVEWCYVKGIIAGMGDGTFNPKGELTPTQLAKLCLVAIGYDAKIEKMEGSVDWAIYTNSLANTKGLYEGLDGIDPTAPMSRENAAQMIWNACHAEMVYYPGNLTMVNGQLAASDRVALVNGGGTTILGNTYKLSEYYAYLINSTYDDETGKWAYTLDATAGTFGSTEAAAGIGVSIADNFATTNLTEVADDFSVLYGQKVLVLATANNATKVTGIVAADSKVLVEGVVGKLPAMTDATATSFKYDGTTYNLDGTVAAIDVYEFNAAAAAAKLNAYKVAKTNTHYAFQLIDNDGNGQGNLVVVYPVSFEQVTAVGTKTFTTSVAGTVTTADVEAYTGIAKKDYVTVTDPATGEKVVYEKQAVAFSGKVTATKTGQIAVDGTWYPVDAVADYTIGDTYDFYTVNGWIVKAIDQDDDTTTEIKYALLLGAKAADSFYGTPNQVKLLLSDGTTETVTSAIDYTTDTTVGAGAGGALDPSNHAYPLVTYTVASGKYTLALADAVAGGNKKATTGYDNVIAAGVNGDEPTNGELKDVAIADDAVIFTMQQATSGDTWSVITGAALKKYAVGSVTGASNIFSSKNTNGFTQVKLAYVTLATTTKVATKNYAYVTSGLTKTEDGTILSFYNVDGQQDDVTASSVATGVAAGSVIKYTLDSKDKYVIEQSDASLGAITAWDGKKIEITDADGSTVTTSTVDGETVVFYIDSANKVGTEGEIALARDYEAKDGKVLVTGENVYYVATNNGHADVLIVDVNSNLKAATGSTTSLTSSVTATGITSALASNDNVTVDADALTAGSVTIGAGKTVTLADTDSAANKLTVTLDGGKLVVTKASDITTSGQDFAVTGEGTVELKGDVTSETMSKSNDQTTVAALGGTNDTTAKSADKANVDATAGTVKLTMAKAPVALTGAGKLTTLGFDSFDAIAAANGSTSVGAYYFELSNLPSAALKLKAVKVLKDGTTVNCDGALNPAGNGHPVASGTTNEDFIMLLGDQVEKLVFSVYLDSAPTVVDYTITITLTDPA